MKPLLLLWRQLRNQYRSPLDMQRETGVLLRELVKHAAANVPLYADLYGKHGVDADRVDTPEALRALPLIDRGTLKSAGQDDWLDRTLRADEPTTSLATSGSTGSPLGFRVRRRENVWRKAQYLRPYVTNGLRVRDRSLRLTGYPDAPLPRYRRFVFPEHRIGCSQGTAEALRAFATTRPTVLQGYPSALRPLAEAVLESGTDASSVRLVFSDSEILTPETRTVLEQAFGTPPVDVFGTIETENIAYTCSAGGGFHVASDSVVAEVVREGRPCRPGEVGELVCTVLYNRTMPFIRYRTGDLVAWSEGDCACGRRFPLLKLAGARADDQILMPDGSRRSPHGMIAPFRWHWREIAEFRIVQRTVRDFEVALVPGREWDVTLADRIVEWVRDAAPGARVSVSLHRAVDRTAGGKLLIFSSPASREDTS